MQKFYYVLLLLCFTTSCSDNSTGAPAPETEETSTNPITQTTDNKHYTNEHFKLSIEKPASWYVSSIEEQLELQQQGSQIIAGDNTALQDMLDSAMDTTMPLFSFFEHNPATYNDLNPNIGGVAENIAAYPNIKSGCDYLDSMKQLMKQSDFPLTFSATCGTTNINGTTFGYLDASATINGISLNQRYLACIQEEYAIGIVYTSFDEATKQSVEQVLATMKVSCSS